MQITVREIPGHTPACCLYLAQDAAFCGDALFLPHLGTGRADFPGGSAQSLYHSITTQIYSLPDDTKLFTGHDYPKAGEQPQCMTTVGLSKQQNVLLCGSTSEAEFIKSREARDKTLTLPRLMYFSMLVNIHGGLLPEPESNGQRYFKLPILQFPS